MKDELKPCPFCGNEDIKIEFHGYDIIRNDNFYLIFCDKCDVEMTVCGDKCSVHRQDAIAAWNTRHVDLEGLILSEEEICDIIFQERINGDWTRESVAKEIHDKQATAIREYLR